MTFASAIDFTVGLMLVGAMLLMLVRLFIGPTLYDRVLAVNAFGTKIVLFLAVFALAVGRADSLDIALLYALINFVATIAILKFFSYRSLEVALDEMAPAPARDDKGEGA
ncbi:cation:proton antiporter [Alkalicaulis satelles]|uniref:Cation:proton antiporter n=1 Tax=Alkalicaulis satelles TaxID=2609175 RepID=A0A5M6ZJI8_9PROT|nr:monovalent cation/H+ antiporter complex subunit F [Alkalicaulis satelles]KAA5804510.1 cation:proton antiporter [Alkalicaulis satelles]